MLNSWKIQVQTSRRLRGALAQLTMWRMERHWALKGDLVEVTHVAHG